MPGTIQTFDNSDQAMAYMQSIYGTAFWSQYEYERFPFYSYQTYPVAGQTSFTFFTSTIAGTTTLYDTNMLTAGNFQGGYYLLVKSIACKLRIKTNSLAAWDGTDASTLCSDLFAGLVQAGALQWTINSFQYLQLPKPFLYCPPGQGDISAYVIGNQAATVSGPPQATLNNRRQGYQLTRPVLIEPGQTFQITISFPGGLVPVIATASGLANDSTNPLQIGVELDGTLFRPVSS